jgi:hypothetical protein
MARKKERSWNLVSTSRKTRMMLGYGQAVDAFFRKETNYPWRCPVRMCPGIIKESRRAERILVIDHSLMAFMTANPLVETVVRINGQYVAPAVAPIETIDLTAAMAEQDSATRRRSDRSRAPANPVMPTTLAAHDVISLLDDVDDIDVVAPRIASASRGVPSGSPEF